MVAVLKYAETHLQYLNAVVKLDIHWIMMDIHALVRTLYIPIKNSITTATHILLLIQM